MPKPLTDLRDGKPFTIYALVCPLTSEVKYVGQTIHLTERRRGAHGQGKTATRGPLAPWLRTLGHMKPYKVILESGINRRVMLPKLRFQPHEVWLSSCLEAKWIKRFRRTILNADKGQAAAALLVNPVSLPWE